MHYRTVELGLQRAAMVTVPSSCEEKQLDNLPPVGMQNKAEISTGTDNFRVLMIPGLELMGNRLRQIGSVHTATFGILKVSNTGVVPSLDLILRSTLTPNADKLNPEPNPSTIILLPPYNLLLPEHYFRGGPRNSSRGGSGSSKRQVHRTFQTDKDKNLGGGG